MKALIVFGVLLTLGLILLQHKREQRFSKTVISLGSFALLLSFGVMGGITRPIIPLFLAHLVLITLAWIGLLYYIFRGRYLWWVIFSPAVTILLFVALSLLEGSRYEDMWGSLF